MKEAVLSNCEKSFIINCIKDGRRLDGRNITDFRDIRLNFGSEWGSCHVYLGETRVLAQVSCDVVQPKSTRPNEGLLHINVELGPMAAQHFEVNRPSEVSVQLNRILERAFKDSRAIDLESLCIVSDEKVWNLRVDVNVLNHEGNIIDCASAATLAALCHFKRPDVSTSGDEVTIHTYAEKDPITIPLHHYPVCVSYSIFEKGSVAVADPTALEERVAEASLVFGLNSYKELCGLHLGGTTLTNPQLLIQTANKAARRAKEMVDLIKVKVAEDETRRVHERPVGFTECIISNSISTYAQDRISIRLKQFNLDMCTNNKYVRNVMMNVDKNDHDNNEIEVKQLNQDSAVLLLLDGETTIKNPQTSKWIPDKESDDSEEDDHENTIKSPVKEKKQKIDHTIKKSHSSDSEEESVIVL